MKKLLLLSALCVFAQVRTEESKFPEMTEEQKRELEGIKNILHKYRLLQSLEPVFFQHDTRIEGLPRLCRVPIVLEKHYTFARVNGDVTFYHDEVDSYDALERMLKTDCQNTNMFTGQLNPSAVKACRALRDILKNAQVFDDYNYYYQALNAIVDRPVNR